MKPKILTLRQIIIRTAKAKDIILKEVRKTQRVTYKGTPSRLSADFCRNSAGQKGVE